MYRCIQVKADSQLKNFLERENIMFAVLITPNVDTLVILYSKSTANLAELQNYAYELLEFIPSNLSNPLN